MTFQQSRRKEIENCLFAHPNVADVSVVGLPDEKYGEVVAAFVVKRGELQAEEVREWVRDRLCHHLVPKHVFFVDTMRYPRLQVVKYRSSPFEAWEQTF